MNNPLLKTKISSHTVGLTVLKWNFGTMLHINKVMIGDKIYL